MTNNIKLATRKSPLALAQANMVKNFLIDNGVFDKVDLIFSCLPAGLFQSKIIENLDPNIPIIDLSGDFRLENKRIYEKFYDISHKNFHLRNFL